MATEDLKAKIEKTGIPSERIVVSGIPIKPSFEQRLPEAEILEKYQLRQGRTYDPDHGRIIRGDAGTGQHVRTAGEA